MASKKRLTKLHTVCGVALATAATYALSVPFAGAQNGASQPVAPTKPPKTKAKTSSPINPYAEAAAPTPRAPAAPVTNAKAAARPGRLIDPYKEGPLDNPYRNSVAAPTPPAGPTAPTGPTGPAANPVAVKQNPFESGKPALAPEPASAPTKQSKPKASEVGDIVDTKPSQITTPSAPSETSTATRTMSAAVTSPIPPRLSLNDLASLQGLMAVDRLDGWLLADRAQQNTIAVSLVLGNSRELRQPWMFLVPSKGSPAVLCHTSECHAFPVARHVEYSNKNEFSVGIKKLLAGKKAIAVESSAKSVFTNYAQLDAGLLEAIRTTGVSVRSSDTLVQHTKAMWGAWGKASHAIAAQHLGEVKNLTMQFLRRRLYDRIPVTESEVSDFAARAMQARNLIGPRPIVAAGSNTSIANYQTPLRDGKQVTEGNLVLLSFAARDARPDSIYAALSWVAVVANAATEEQRKVFELAAAGRDHALAMLTDPKRTKQGFRGHQVDSSTRVFLEKSLSLRATIDAAGHSIDTEVYGHGANLDDLLSHDNRPILAGTGLVVGPGVFVAGKLGVRTSVSVYVGTNDIEVTTPAQQEIEALLGGPATVSREVTDSDVFGVRK